ncbi:MAG: flagellar basal body-associated protein FliL [Thermoleophilia bacterium]
MKKKIMILAPVLLIVLGIAAKMTILAPAPVDEKALAKKPGPVYTMAEPFVVNLADAGDTPHFAKVGIAMRFSELSAGEILPPKGEKPAEVEDDSELRDIVISTIQSHTSAQLTSVAGRESVKKAIVARVNKQTELKILEVYYTEFAVQ